MKSHSEAIFDGRDIDLLHKAERIVEHVPDRNSRDELVRCHEVARIVGKILGLPVQDGYYGFVDHSWCWMAPMRPKLSRARIGVPHILDPYCVGSLPQVRIVVCDNTALPPAGVAYRADRERDDIDQEFVRRTILAILRIDK